jgi:hypothetical protein
MRQTGNEGQGDVDFAELLLLAQHPIVEVHLAAGDLDVVHGESRRWLGRWRPGHELVDQVGEVETPVG